MFINKLLFSSSLLLALSVASSTLAAPFSFSDFSFQRKDSSPTQFHITEFEREDGTAAGTGLEAFAQFIREESNAIDLKELEARKLDATKLNITNNIEDLKVYFIDEDAGFRNQLGLSVTGATNTEGLVFVNASIGNRKRLLRSGDYVSIGEVKAGSTLDFSLLANGYQNDNFYTYYADKNRNPDKLQHVIAYDYQGYLVLAWEDLYNGGDKDYNDIVFAIALGEDNLAQIPDEPSSNQFPAAVDDEVTTPYGTGILVDVLANDRDPDGDSLIITELDSFLSEGEITLVEGKVLYTPSENFEGTDNFTYTVSDPKGATDSATVTISVGEDEEDNIFAD